MASENVTPVHMETSDYFVSQYFVNNSLNEIFEEFVPFAVFINKAVTPVWYVVGTLGNALSLIIWVSARMRKSNSSAYYLAALSLSDMFLLLSHIAIELRYTWGVDVISSPVICEMYMVICMMPQYLSILLVLGFTTERYIAVCHPFKKETFCTKWRACMVICGLSVFSLLVCCVQGYFWEFNVEVKTCEVRLEFAKADGQSVWSVWTWTSGMLFFGVVPLAVLVLNVFVIVEVCRVSQRPLAVGQRTGLNTAQNTTTVMLLTVSFYTIFTVLPVTVIHSMEGIYANMNYGLENAEALKADPMWQSYFTYYTVLKCAEEVSLSHYAVNFFIYLITGKNFRDRFKQRLKSLTKISCKCKLRGYREIARSKRLSLTSNTKVSKF